MISCFINYCSLEILLAEKAVTATPVRSVVFAASLWKIYKHQNSLKIIQNNLSKHTSECLNIVLLSLGYFKDNADAKSFIISCLQGDDDVLIEKANITIGSWAYSGIAALRENDLMDLLKPANRNSASFKKALEQLKEILTASFNN